MTAFLPENWEFPIIPNLIKSEDPDERLKYQQELVGRLNESHHQIANAIYGENSNLYLTPVGATAGSGISDANLTSVGYYVRFGHLVWFTAYVEWNDSDHGGTGNLEIHGLPVASKNVTNLRSIVSILNIQSGAEFNANGVIEPGANTISAIWDGTTQVQVNGADYSLIITGMYRAI